MIIDRADELAVLPAPYREHYATVVEALAADDRVRAVWLSGSIARGIADAGSDLDLLVAVADDALDGIVDRWREWLDPMLPVLLAVEVPRSKLIIAATTADLCRVDLVLEPVSGVGASPHRARLVIFDRDDLTAGLRVPDPQPGPDPERATMIITEFWRQQAIAPAMLDDRGDLLCLLQGTHGAWQMIYDVFVESNRPVPAGGVKQVSSRLTAEQRGWLEGLPPLAADRETLITADAALRSLMATHGRSAAERIGARYPAELAAAVDAALRERWGR